MKERIFSRLICFIAGASLFDMMATMYGIHAGFYTEANPIMAVVIEQGFLEFIITKTLFTSVGLTGLYLWRNRFLAKAGIVLCAWLYAVVTTMHSICFAVMLWNG